LFFSTLKLNEQGHYKISGIVTNRSILGDELIHWYQQRCGRQFPAMKEDLAGGSNLLGDFGENVAWWMIMIMIIAFNLNYLMKHLVLPKYWAHTHDKLFVMVSLVLQGMS